MSTKKEKVAPKKKEKEVKKTSKITTNSKKPKGIIDIRLNLKPHILKDLEIQLYELLRGLIPSFSGNYSLKELIEKFLESFYELADRYGHVQDMMQMIIEVIDEDEIDLTEILKALKKFKNTKPTNKFLPKKN